MQHMKQAGTWPYHAGIAKHARSSLRSAKEGWFSVRSNYWGKEINDHPSQYSWVLFPSLCPSALPNCTWWTKIEQVPSFSCWLPSEMPIHVLWGKAVGSQRTALIMDPEMRRQHGQKSRFWTLKGMTEGKCNFSVEENNLTDLNRWT